MASQLFQIRETVPGLPGEWVCAGCQASMVMIEPSREQPAGAMTMEHTDGCPEVRKLTGG